MDISIFGLGYVGCISVGCLASNGHNIIGVDVNKDKVDLINQGKPTVVEKDIDKLIGENFKNGRIRAMTDGTEAVQNSEVSIICVGTPSTKTGHLNLDFIYKVARQIGEGMNNKNGYHTIFIRSTVPPGTNARVSGIVEEASGKKAVEEFAVVSNPEFLREGSAVFDYYNPPYTVIASEAPAGLEKARAIYSDIDAPIYELQVLEAEILKYVNNSFHALKITFANEVGNICKNMGIDSHAVMDIFCKDTKLNISPYYMKPGFAYGGSCLPKDLKALNTMAHDQYIVSPVLNSIDFSNKEQIGIAYDMIVNSGKMKIGFFGLSFKAGTDDLRSSPTLELIEWLIGKGYQVGIFDNNLNISRMTGINKAIVHHIYNYLVQDMDELIRDSELIVITNKEKIFEEMNIPEEKMVIDLVRVKGLESHPNYNGICW